MSTASSSAAFVNWHDQCRLLGVQVQAYFFDPTEVNARVSFVERQLPVFTHARPRRLSEEGERQQFLAGELCADPDAVLEHGNGLICLTYRHTDRLMVERAHWAAHMRADLMLQSVAGAMAVAGARQQPAAAMLRLGNALFHFAPSPPVLECLATNVAAARRYWSAPTAVNASQLAAFCEPRLRSLPGIAVASSPASWAGVAADNWT